MSPNPPKRGGESGTAKMDFLHNDFYILAIWTSHKNTPISRISCLNVENPENQADQFWTSLVYIRCGHVVRDFESEAKTR